MKGNTETLRNIKGYYRYIQNTYLIHIKTENTLISFKRLVSYK